MTQPQDKRNTKEQKPVKMVGLFLRVPEPLNKRLRRHLFNKSLQLQDFGAEAFSEKLDREKGAAA